MKYSLSRDGRQLTIRDLCKNCARDAPGPQVIQCNASNVHGYEFTGGYINVLGNHLSVALCNFYNKTL